VSNVPTGPSALLSALALRNSSLHLWRSQPSIIPPTQGLTEIAESESPYSRDPSAVLAMTCGEAARRESSGTIARERRWRVAQRPSCVSRHSGLFYASSRHLGAGTTQSRMSWRPEVRRGFLSMERKGHCSNCDPLDHRWAKAKSYGLGNHMDHRTASG